MLLETTLMTFISDEVMSDDQLHKNDHALSLAFTFVLTCCLLCRVCVYFDFVVVSIFIL